MFIKLAGISAALAAFFVVAFEAPTAQSRSSAKLHYDRVAAEPAPRGEVRLASAMPVVTRVASDATDCRGQAWPYVDPTCMAAGRPAVRTITIERRDAPNTSTLVRVPAETR